MGKTAFLFSGQGAQYVGMGQDIYEYNQATKDIFDYADSLTQGKVTRLCFEGPEEELKLTINTQPCILAVEAAMLAVAQDSGLKADITAGFSLGEYGALICAGVLTYQEAFRLVLKRAELMNEAALSNDGGMAAILGLSVEAVEEACQEVEGYVEPVNLNCPGQVVVAGEKAAVQLLSEKLSAGGAKCIALSVNGAFHSEHMNEAAIKYAEAVKEFDFKAPTIPLVSNVTGRPEDCLKELAVIQMHSPVYWEKSIRYMIEQGVDRFIEIGPGTVLTGLMKKIDRKIESFHISKLIQGVKA